MCPVVKNNKCKSDTIQTEIDIENKNSDKKYSLGTDSFNFFNLLVIYTIKYIKPVININPAIKSCAIFSLNTLCK